MDWMKVAKYLEDKGDELMTAAEDTPFGSVADKLIARATDLITLARALRAGLPEERTGEDDL